MLTPAQLLDQGYRPGAPSPEAEEIDAHVVEGLTCRHCGGRLHYEGYCHEREYLALAVCTRCGHTLAF